MRIVRHVLCAVMTCMIVTTAQANSSGSVTSRSTQDVRTQREDSVNRERSLEVQRQRSHEDRTGEEQRSSDSHSERSTSESSQRRQEQTTDRLTVRQAPLSMLTDLFRYIEEGRSAPGPVATAVQSCRLITSPQAPRFPNLEPKSLHLSSGACAQLSGQKGGDKTLAECRFEERKAVYDWYTNQQPAMMSIRRNRELEQAASCWTLYGLVAEAALLDLSVGQAMNPSEPLTIALARSLGKQLGRAELIQKARELAEHQLGDHCVVPTTRGRLYEGRYEWHCGAFYVNPIQLSANFGELTIFGKGDSLFGRSWALETSRSQDRIFAVSSSLSETDERSRSTSLYAAADSRQSESRNASMRQTQRHQSELTGQQTSTSESSFSVSQPGVKGGN